MNRFALLLLVVSLPAFGEIVPITDPAQIRGSLGESRLRAVTRDGRFVLVEAQAGLPSAVDGQVPLTLLLYDRRRAGVEQIDVFHSGPYQTSRWRGSFALAENGRYIYGELPQDSVDSIFRYDRERRLLTFISRGKGTSAFFNPLSLTLDGEQTIISGSYVAFQGPPAISYFAGSLETTLVSFGRQETFPDSVIASASQTVLNLDGRYLITPTRDTSNRMGLSRIALPAGEPEALGTSSQVPMMSADGQVVAIVQEPPSGPRLVRWSFRPPRGADVIAQAPDLRLDFVSADGSRVFFQSGGRSLMWASGDLIEIAQPVEQGRNFSTVYSPNGSLLLWSAVGEGYLTDDSGRVLRDFKPSDGEWQLSSALLSDRGLVFEASGQIPGIGFTPTQQIFAVDLVSGSSDIIATLEAPAQGSTVSGIETIRGWALSRSSEIESVEYAIDGRSYGALPYGASREDVGDAFPQIARADESGFASVFSFNELTPGYHEITVTIRSATGDVQTRSSEFLAEPITAGFVPDREAIDLSAADVRVANDQITLNGVLVAGEARQIILEWNPATQNFEVISATDEPSR